MAIESEQDLKQQIREHGKQIERDTALCSGFINYHPSYQAILAMGMAAVPWLLKDLQDYTNCSYMADVPVWYWIVALRQITGEMPWDKRDAGRFDRIAKNWIQWGIDHDYLQGERTPVQKPFLKALADWWSR